MLYTQLSNGVEIPLLGYGVFQIPDYKEAKQAVLHALETGYRLIDTAQAYQNEKAVGDAIKESGIARSEIFITTKIWVSNYGYEKTLSSTQESMDKLGVDYLDLMLLHQPIGDYINSWKALEKLYADGSLKAIGMANMYPHVVTDLCNTFKTKPLLNQVEIHPFFQQQLNLDTMQKYGVVPQAWGPFNEGKNNFFSNELLASIGKKYDKSVAQVALRWNIQRGVVVIPKSVHLDRIQQNFEIFDFELSATDMEQIKSLDTGKSEIVDHFDPNFVQFLHNYQI